MNQSEIVSRLRNLARLARLEAQSPLGREIDSLAEDILGRRRDAQPTHTVTTTHVINGRRIMVQRRRSPFSICV